MIIGQGRTEFTPKHPIEWVKEITTFGLSYTNTREQPLNTWDAPIGSLAKRFESLHVSKASIYARARMVNTYFHPKLLYRAHSFCLDKEKHKDIRKEFYGFVMSSCIRRIAHNTLTQPKEEGGVALRNFECVVTAMRLKFIVKCINGSHPSPLAKFYLDLHLIRLGIRLDNKMPHFTGVPPKFYKDLIPLITKYKTLLLKEDPKNFYKFLNREKFLEGKFIIHQLKRVPLNDPMYRPLEAFKKIKKAEVSEAVKHQTYTLMYGATPTRHNLKRRNRHGVQVLVPCALCGKERESEEHLYMECTVLQTALGWVGTILETNDPNCLRRAVFLHDFPRGDDPAKDAVKSEILLLYRWTVWRARKRAIYDCATYTADAIMKSLKERVRRHAESIKPD